MLKPLQIVGFNLSKCVKTGQFLEAKISHQLDALDPSRPRAYEVLVLELQHERHGEAVVPTSLPTTPCSPVQRAAGHWAGIATLGKLHSCQAKAAARCQASGQHTACIVLAGQRRTASYSSDSTASSEQGGGGLVGAGICWRHLRGGTCTHSAPVTHMAGCLVKGEKASDTFQSFHSSGLQDTLAFRRTIDLPPSSG